MNNSTEASQDLIGATEQQRSRYRDPEFILSWRLMNPSDALEAVRNPETLNDLKKLIWYQRLKKAQKLDIEHKELGMPSAIEEQEITKIKREMISGLPKFNLFTTDTHIYEYVYSGGNPEDYRMIRRIKFVLSWSLSETEMALIGNKYLYIILSDYNITPQKLRELLNICSGDLNKITVVLTAIEKGIIKLEEVTSNTNIEYLAQEVKNQLPGFRNDYEDTHA